MNQVSTLSPQELQQAFQVFSLASSDLCLAYEELRQEGERLTQELALANGELRRQFEAREAERESRQRQVRLQGRELQSWPAAERARFANKTVERLHHLERLVNDMLQFVRGVNAGCEPSAVEDMLSEAFQIIEPQAMARGLLAELCDESGGCVIHVDRQALGGALLSLLENAVQACNAGGSIRLTASVANGQVAFCVSDTGAGIAAALQEHLFEPFFTTRRGGTGLGLAIVRSVAETHGGSISVRSVPGEGSEFRLCLPLAPAPIRALSG